ncbi:MAG: DUF6447 family protein [Pseudomonadota bacterium]|uniref:Uncharacterized protein n=1 Tax=Duganella vulcania TaxID=2692166 RepID=A0A845G8U7_9BURK|nr:MULTISPECIES: DUF6447 family protein [Duganella]MYM89835.1 hypothetical protein [Duganella vulcania]MYN20070.1 hypothetical protein [Duganella vulcania]NVD69477.1 hypothetical protein [Duganella sp. BJB1802]
MDDEIEVTVDGISYKLSELSEAAQEQVANLQFVDAQMAELNAKLAVFQTARNAYQSVLQQLVPRVPQ